MNRGDVCIFIGLTIMIFVLLSLPEDAKAFPHTPLHYQHRPPNNNMATNNTFNSNETSQMYSSTLNEAPSPVATNPGVYDPRFPTSVPKTYACRIQQQWGEIIATDNRCAPLRN